MAEVGHQVDANSKTAFYHTGGDMSPFPELIQLL